MLRAQAEMRVRCAKQRKCGVIRKNKKEGAQAKKLVTCGLAEHNVPLAEAAVRLSALMANMLLPLGHKRP